MKKNVLWVHVVLAINKSAAAKAAGLWVSPSCGFGIVKALRNSAGVILAVKPKSALALVESYA